MLDIPLGINNPDQEVTDPYGQHLENVVVAPTGVRMRLGYNQILSLGTSAKVDGAYDWAEHDVVIAVSNGDVFKLESNVQDPVPTDVMLLEAGDSLLLESGDGMLLETVATLSNVTGGTDMVVGARVSFANYGNYLYLANGGKIQELHPTASVVYHGGKKWTCKLNHSPVAGAGGNEPGVATASSTYWTDNGAASGTPAWSALTPRYGSGKADVLEDVDAPTTVRWVAVADKYLLAVEDGTEKLWFSDVGEPWSWSGDYVAGEFLPDNISAMTVQDGDVWVIGKRSVQVFQNDGVSPWAPSNYGGISHGTIAPYSFIYCATPGTFVWLDERRRLVRLEGRAVRPLNHALNTFLDQMQWVTDAQADYVVLGGMSFYILALPTQGVTIAYNLDNDTWAEWYTGSGRYAANCIVNVPAWDYVVMGHLSDGTLNRLNYNYNTDGAAPIVAKLRTQRLPADRVTRSPVVDLFFTKTAYSDSTGDASLSVRWRDDGNTWTAAQTVTLADKTMTSHVKQVRRCGHYRRYRQYEFTMTDVWPYSLVRAVQR